MRRHGYVGLMMIAAVLASGIILISGLSGLKMMPVYLFILIVIVLSYAAMISQVRSKAIWSMIFLIAIAGSSLVTGLSNLAIVSYGIEDQTNIEQQVNDSMTSYESLLTSYSNYVASSDKTENVTAGNITEIQETPLIVPDENGTVYQKDYISEEYNDREEWEDD